MENVKINKTSLKNAGGGLSVIIPVYNAENTISTCLHSIINQTYTDLQIICINDGSCDSSLELIKKIAKTDSRLEIVDQQNKGASAARNIGIRMARKKYLTFVDADDELNNTMYEKMMRLMTSKNFDCVCCDVSVKHANGKSTKLVIPFENSLCSNKDVLEYAVKPMLGFTGQSTDGLCSLCNKIFKKDIIASQEIAINESRTHGEDWQFCLEYFRYCTSICCVHETLYYYIHRDEKSLVGKYRENYFKLAFQDRKRFQNTFPELDWNNEKKIKEYISIPITSAYYYKLNVKGKDLKNRMDCIYDLCCVDELYLKYIEDSLWNKFIKNKKTFQMALSIFSFPLVCKAKAKIIIKNILKRTKNGI